MAISVTEMLYLCFGEFLARDHMLRIYENEKLVFCSQRNELLPLIEHLEKFVLPDHKRVIIFDRVMGNAAALLAIIAGCHQVFSPLGSLIAIKTLRNHDIAYCILEIILCIQKADGQGMCPMESLSLNKEPSEFYDALKQRINSTEG